MATYPPTAGLIDGLDPANPIDDDKVFGVNNWVQFIQQTIRNQFPTSESGAQGGWDVALSIKASEANALAGVSAVETVQQQLDALDARLSNVEGAVGTGNFSPIGTIQFWPVQEPVPASYADNDPLSPGTGEWRLCDGSVVDGTIYTQLFSILGNTFGGTGAANMQVPDIQGRVLAGRSNGTSRLTGYRQGADDTAQGNVGGEDAHTPVLNELYPHAHTGGVTTAGDQGGTGVAAGDPTNTGISGGGNDVNITQPTMVMAVYIRVL